METGQENIYNTIVQFPVATGLVAISLKCTATDESLNILMDRPIKLVKQDFVKTFLKPAGRVVFLLSAGGSRACVQLYSGPHSPTSGLRRDVILTTLSPF